MLVHANEPRLRHAEREMAPKEIESTVAANKSDRDRERKKMASKHRKKGAARHWNGVILSFHYRSFIHSFPTRLFSAFIAIHIGWVLHLFVVFCFCGLEHGVSQQFTSQINQKQFQNTNKFEDMWGVYVKQWKPFINYPCWCMQMNPDCDMQREKWRQKKLRVQ